MAMCAAALFAGTIVTNYKVLDVSLGDTDDAMRLVQLRAFLNQGNWFDLKFDRVAPPEGYVSHWSRIPDFFMAMIYWVVQPFTSNALAEKAVRIVYPGLWIIPTFVAVCLFAYKFAGHRLVVVATLLILVLNPVTLTQFVAGRIDHHNAQIALAVVAVIAAAFQKLDWRLAIVSGLSCGLMLTIGLEAIPFAVVAAAAVASHFAFSEDAHKSTRAFAASLGLAVLLGFVISYPPERFFETACDALASNLAFPVVTGCIVLFTWSHVQNLNVSLMHRVIGLTLAGTTAAIMYIAIDPACLRGPFGHINPAVRSLWLDRVAEMQPVLSLTDIGKNIRQLTYIYVLLPAFISVFIILRDRGMRSQFAILVVLAAFVVSLPIGLLNLRMAPYISWFATPLICIALFILGKKLSTTAMAGILLAAFILSQLTQPFAVKLLTDRLSSGSTQAQSSFGSCSRSVDFAFLGRQSKGLVLAELDMGPYILALSHHDIAVAPYHRMSDRIIEVMDFFERDTLEQAHAKVKAIGATYVVICRYQAAGMNIETNSSLHSQLRARTPPTWLVPIVNNDSDPILIFAVK
jgi:hypothetical protein